MLRLNATSVVFLGLCCTAIAGCAPTAEEQATDVFAQGRLHHEAGDLDKAAACYDLAIELDPYNAEVYIHRAEIRLVTGNSDGALADCSEAIRLDPDMADAYKSRAAVYIARNDLEPALADLNEAIRLDATDAMAYRARAHIRAQLGQPGEAEADKAKADDLERLD